MAYDNKTLDKDDRIAELELLVEERDKQLQEQSGKLEALQEQVSWMSSSAKTEEQALKILQNAKQEAATILQDAKDKAETTLNYAEADADVLNYKVKMFMTVERERLEEERNRREESIKHFEKRSEEIITQAQGIRKLALEGVDIDEYLRSIGMYDVIRANIDHDDSLTGMNEALADLRSKLKENLSAQKKLKKKHGGVSTYVKWSSPSRFFHLTSSAYATLVFDVVSENIVSKVAEDGLEVSLEKLAGLKFLCEYHSNSTFYAEAVRLKTEELKLVYDIHVLREEKKEEQQRIKQRLADERQAQKEFERELKRAQKDEDNARRALEAAQIEAAKQQADKEKYAKLQEQIEKLQAALKEAEERNQRTISMAQQTRSGWVYIISNIGSFGEGVYKIGLTRRPDPMVRVFELGDASVPFPFDVHAFIFSEDAPALETALHQAFDKQKMNAVNGRKEYFKVSLDDIKKKVRELGYDVEFEDYAYAPQFRDSILKK